MSSRSCTKSYGRKVNSVAPSSIQFDKLFRENSNRPSAAKSAGTVGKWGITSFTSIRSTNINGKRNEIRGSLGSKRLKLDYDNQNSNVNSAADPFSFDSNEKSTPAPVQPKKFFKSRNVVASSIEETRKDAAIYRQVPDSQYGYSRSTKDSQSKSSSKSASHLSSSSSNAAKKSSNATSESLANNLNREESKPPIVLRICKGTAQLVCNNETDSEPDTYRISAAVTNSKVNAEAPRSKKEPVADKSDKSEAKMTRASLASSSSTAATTQPQVTTVSIPLDDDSGMRRTTRSRAKTLHLDVATATNSPVISSTPTTPGGLSLTLRKSVTDSNNTLISHYDIVKTDCEPNYVSKPTIEPLIGRDQPLPTTTQELIDILSSDVDPTRRTTIESDNVHAQQNMASAQAQSEDLDESIDDDVQHCSIDLATNQVVPKLPDKIGVEPEAPPPPPPPPPLSIVEPEVAAAKTLVDQDWFSGSEDSESISGNTESENIARRDESIAEETERRGEEEQPRRENDVAKPATTKKGSIFKSRSTGATNGKRRALYKHKWSDSDKDAGPTDHPAPSVGTPSSIPSGSSADTQPMTFEEEFDSTQLTRVVTYPDTDDANFTDEFGSAITSVRCGKNVKGFYTVVKNVKKAHQIQESGEFQEFNDDVEYILDTLRENNPNATRCLSAIRLASKCMAPAFRMHVRAHGTVAKFFKALHDATKDQSLGLCTATVMFVLSQDRLAMDLDRDCLELMLSLLESDASHKDALDDCGLSRVELLKNKEKVRQLCADIQAQGHAKHLNLDNITVGQLAMETLLSLTSRRAGEWFKEELRELGGLEHIVKTIKDCHRHIIANDIPKNGWNDPLLDKLRKVDRCLRVLENVTHMNEENQVYLLKYDGGILVSTLASLYHLCGRQIIVHPTFDPSDKSSTGAVVRECLFAIIKVFINLTHRFNQQSFGSVTVGSQAGIMDCTLFLLLRVPESIPEEKRFDMMMLALILLINLVEQCEDNKKLIIESKAPPSSDNGFEGEESAVEVLIDLFYKREEMARLEEQKTDAILDGKKDSEQTETVSTTTKSQEEFIEETVTKLLQKAGKHMEHTLIAAYVVLLLGNLVMDNKDYESLLRNNLPDKNFATMVAVLQKFFNFMNLTASNEVSSCGIAATEKVIKFLKMSDARIEEERNALPLPAMEDPSIIYPS